MPPRSENSGSPPICWELPATLTSPSASRRPRRSSIGSPHRLISTNCAEPSAPTHSAARSAGPHDKPGRWSRFGGHHIYGNVQLLSAPANQNPPDGTQVIVIARPCNGDVPVRRQDSVGGIKVDPSALRRVHAHPGV